ncbi:TrlF family AAA-like ATPase [Flavobacterium anhuiense]|uniref:TrlF family AAA-like ATPase n=1 Tax=Flavobacterium anhuiense TaxID=459526 RepID=UPI003D98A978
MSNRGSEWRIWDLHIHTPYSINQQYNNSADGWQKFINALENLPVDVKVIGITDYYFIDGYKKVMEFKNNGRLNNIDKIFPILEFRIDTFGTASQSDLQKINLHILFDVDENELDKEIQKIKKEFIEIIPLTKLPQHMTKMLTRDNLAAEGGNNLQNGFSNLIPSTDKVFELINSSVWKEKTFLFLGYKEWSNLEKSQQLKPFKEKLYNDVMAFFSNGYETNEKNQKWLDEFGNKKLLHSLDIHGFDLLDTYEFDNGVKKQCEKYKCFTWIKADTTFQGLKQIIYEPEERIKIQKDKPESEKLENLMIDKVTFTSSNDRFTPETIFFNKNLNVIIGGKSSGKSILLYKIARTLYGEILPYNSDEKLLKNDVLKYKDTKDNKYKDLYDLKYITDSEIDKDFNFQIELFSGSKQTLKDRSSQSSILPSIKYIPQNHLSNLVDKSRKNGATLKKIIRDLILEIPELRRKYDDFIEQAKRNDTQRNQDIDFYFTLKDELVKKEAELSTKGDVKALEEGINFHKQKIQELSKDFTQDEQSKYKILTEQLSFLKIKENQISSDFEKLNNFQIDLKRFLVEYFNKKKIILDSLQTESIKNEYSSKLQFVDEAIASIYELEKDFKKNEDNNFIEGAFFANEIKQIDNEINEINTALKPYNAKLEDQKQILALQKSITTDEGKLADITQFSKEIVAVKDSIKKQKEKIFVDFEENFKLYEKIIIDLHPRIDEIQNETDNIEIIPSIKYDFPKFRTLCEDTFNIRSFNNKGFEYIYQYSDNEPNSALFEIEYKEIGKALEVLFDKIESKQILPKGGNTEKESCKKILTDFFFDHWDVKSDNDDIHKMSTGKASFILLKLIIKLSNENGPILIDQPEDNLDNRSVSKELVKFLKEKKKERQIILVTHNPNIVVNADAENIIVANQKGQNDSETSSPYQFDYINGALENNSPKDENEKDLLKSMGIREHIADIVEGGKEAFKKREEKYGF